MEGDEAHGQGLHLILHLQQFFLAEVVDAQLGGGDMDNLPVVELHAELIRKYLRQLPAACTILAADGEHKILLHDTTS